MGMQEMTAEETAAYCKILLNDKAVVGAATQRARKESLSVFDKAVRRRAGEVLDEIEDALMGTNISALPAICGIAVPEDGSFLIEWITPDIRLGFCIEVDSADSWYIVSRVELDIACDHGLLSESFVKDHVFKFLRIINEGKE